MMKPDFSSYSLAIIKDSKIVHSSQQSGLRPLAEAVNSFKGKLDNCILHDKVIGLAAARIIVFSEMIDSVKTNLMSEQAKALLEENGTALEAAETVQNIMNKDKTDICPMEKKAQEITNNKEFFLELLKKLNIVNNTI